MCHRSVVRWKLDGRVYPMEYGCNVHCYMDNHWSHRVHGEEVAERDEGIPDNGLYNCSALEFRISPMIRRGDEETGCQCHPSAYKLTRPVPLSTKPRKHLLNSQYWYDGQQEGIHYSIDHPNPEQREDQCSTLRTR